MFEPIPLDHRGGMRSDRHGDIECYPTLAIAFFNGALWNVVNVTIVD
jgi:hypothetical protein